MHEASKEVIKRRTLHKKIDFTVICLFKLMVNRIQIKKPFNLEFKNLNCIIFINVISFLLLIHSTLCDNTTISCSIINNTHM